MTQIVSWWKQARQVGSSWELCFQTKQVLSGEMGEKFIQSCANLFTEGVVTVEADTYANLKFTSR